MSDDTPIIVLSVWTVGLMLADNWLDIAACLLMCVIWLYALWRT